MTNLSVLEDQFQAYLFQSNPEFCKQVIGTDKVPVDVRLHIYGHAYRTRLQEALMANYSVFHAYVGDETFESLCDAYIDAHPSTFKSIRWFGDAFSIFISKSPLHEEYPYLSELAQFEWTLGLVFDAADAPLIEIETMQDIPPEAWENMRLECHPSVHRLSLSWNVVQIWQAMMADETPDDPLHAQRPTEWLIWRKGLETQFSSLSVHEAWAIDAIQKDSNFGELCEGICQWFDELDAGMQAASLLKGWITEALISKVLIDL
jgi:hypothetical protein